MVEITYFVHGTTTDNLAKKATGWLGGELSEKGIMQANALKEIIKEQYFDVVFCSDLKRAVDSAKIDFSGRNIKLIQDARLRECNYGDYNGKDDKLADYHAHIEQSFPNGESMLDVEARISNFIDFLKQNYDNKKIAIVAHKAPQLALDVILNNMSWQQALANDWRITKNWQPGWKYYVN
ncbi:MAG: histidine phosphatase family protein [Clostridiales bacterium]|nr:histidine phosphatase family protein [Clostridiales bacterium]